MEVKQVESDNKFSMQYIKDLAEEISRNNLVTYEDLPHYDLFLSQVIDYLNDKFQGEKYTNNIVQNYIKSGVISKPEDGKKRGYTKVHLAQLALLSYMRPILNTDEIKKVFGLAFNEINDKDDDLISWEMIYKVFSEILKETFEKSHSRELIHEEKLKSIIKDSNIKDEDEERILVFLVVMTLIAEASSIKKLVQKLVQQYGIDL